MSFRTLRKCSGKPDGRVLIVESIAESRDSRENELAVPVRPRLLVVER